MKSKIIIENGHEKIVLHPENNFEVKMLENADNSNYDVQTQILSESHIGGDTRIEINLKEKQNNGS